MVVVTVPAQQEEVERLAVWLSARQDGCCRRRDSHGVFALLLPPSCLAVPVCVCMRQWQVG